MGRECSKLAIGPSHVPEIQQAVCKKGVGPESVATTLSSANQLPQGEDANLQRTA